MALKRQLPLDAGRGDLKVIRAVYGVRIVKHRIDRVVNALTVVDTHAALRVDGYAQYPSRTFLYEINIPDIASGVSHDRHKQLVNLSRYAAEFFFHTVRTFLFTK